MLSGVSLVQLIRFIAVELTHPGLNSRFDMSVAFTTNYSFSERRRPVDSGTLLMTDFINFKIKSTQSFRGAHRSRIYVYMFIGVSAHTYVSMFLLCL
jgi:hypothetical protein